MRNKFLLAVIVLLAVSASVKAQWIKKDRTDSYLITTDLSKEEIKSNLLKHLKSKNWEPSQLEKNDITEFSNSFSSKVPQQKYGMALFYLTKFKFDETITIVDGGIIVKLHNYDNDLYSELIGDPYTNNPSLEEQIKTADKNPEKWVKGGSEEIVKVSAMDKSGFTSFNIDRWNEWIKPMFDETIEAYKKAINGTIKSISEGETETWRLIDSKLIPLDKKEFKKWAKENNLSKSEIKEWDAKRKEALK